MKWIGQHIFDLISRFRTTVFLENLETSTETNILVVDSDGKVTKNADAGDDMSFTVEDGDTTDVVISDGKHWKFVEGGNININWTDTDNGTSSDEYDLTFTGATLQELLISASHSIKGTAGQDVELASAQDLKFRIDYDQSSTAGTHTFDFVNGAGSVVASIDESGVPTFSIGGKGSASSAVLVDGGSGAVKSRTLAEFKGDASLGNVEDKSSATIRGEIVSGNVPNNAADTTGSAATLTSARAINGVNFDGSAPITITAAGSTLSDTVTVAKGGTGATSLTDGGILLGSGTGAVTAFPVLGDGEILIGDGTTDPVALDVGSSTAITVLGTVATGVWNGTTIATANTAAKVTSVIAGDGIDVDSTTGDVTVTAETASATNPGVVELATTAEADTGTDAARAVTPAGLKSHVDKRFSYQYLTWEVNTNSFTSTNYEWPASNGGFGSEEFTSNTSVTRNTSIVDGHADTPTYAAPKNLQHMGWYVPHACQLVGVSGAFRNNGGLTTPRDVAVFVGTPDIGSTATPTYTQRAFAAGDDDGGQCNSRTYTTNVTLATPFDLVAGNVVMPAVCDAAGNASVFMQGNFSIIIRTLII